MGLFYSCSLSTSHSEKKNLSDSKKERHSELYKYLEKHKYNHVPFLSIILPVYNEEKTIKRIINSLPKHEAVEIIIVDDHSTDNSLEEIKKVKGFDNLHVLEHRINRGYGAALNTGIHFSKGRIFLTMDSDGQHRAEDIINLVKPIIENNADIVIGSRYKGTMF